MPMAFGWDGKIFDGTGKFWIGREADADGMGKYLMGRENFGLDVRVADADVDVMGKYWMGRDVDVDGKKSINQKLDVMLSLHYT